MATEPLSDVDNAFAQLAYRAGQYRAQVIELTEKNDALQAEIAVLQRRLNPSGWRRLFLFCREAVVLALLVWLGWFARDLLGASQQPYAVAPSVVFATQPPQPTYQSSTTTRQQRDTSQSISVPSPTSGFDPLPAVEQPVHTDPAADVYIVATPTAEPAPLPEPGEPGFSDSFQEPTCSAMIGYLPGHPCYGRINQERLPAPGQDGFAESFR